MFINIADANTQNCKNRWCVLYLQKESRCYSDYNINNYSLMFFAAFTKQPLDNNNNGKECWRA